MAFFVKVDMVAAVMPGTAIESGDRPNLPPHNRIAAARGARHPSRGRLQYLPNRTLRVWFASALFSLAISACTPVGAVNKQSAQEGVNADAGELSPDASDAAASSGRGEPSQSGGRVGIRARAGAGGRETQVSGGGGMAGKPNAQTSGGRAASGGNRAEAGRAGGSAGRDGVSQSGTGGEASSEHAGAGGMAGADAEAAGGAGAAGSSPNTDAGTSGSAGTGAAGTAANGGWYCTQFDRSCTCVQSGEVSADECMQPKPTCCFTLVRLGANACACWPEDSEECRTQMTEVPDAKRTPHCPP